MLIIYSTVAWFIILLIPKFLIGIFTADAALITAGVPSLHIYFFGFFLMAFMFTGQTVFVGIGKAKFAIFFSILRKGIVVIPLILLLPIWFGVNGVFFGRADFKFDRRFGVLYNNVFCGLQKIII